MSTEIQFLGAAGTVTGSRYLLSHAGRRILVDCGLFQGLKSLRLKNWDEFPVSPASLDAVVLTHAHIDHSGYIPRLVQGGFQGRIYCTQATRDLCEILLPDAGYLAEEEAEYLNRRKRTKHNPALPLFTLDEAKHSLRYFKTQPLDQWQKIVDGIEFKLSYAGHILGASFATVKLGGARIVFSGDVGRMEDRIFYPPSTPEGADYLVVESTYGNRLHSAEDPLDVLEKVIRDTHARGGVILIPSFAVGRAQALMHLLLLLKRQKRIPDLPMYLNSPMATDVTELFLKHHKLHRLSAEEAREVCNVVKYIHTPEESKALNLRSGPMLIISASGMLTGGRILHHLKAFLGDERNTVLLAGFQSAGTRGEALERGAKEIKIHGEYYPVKAQIVSLENMSAHADYAEILEWLKKSSLHPKRVFVTHGEPSAADEFRRRIEECLSWPAFVPEYGQKVRLDV